MIKGIRDSRLNTKIKLWDSCFWFFRCITMIKNTQETISNTIRMEKFNGKNSFNLWRIKMRALLKEQCVQAPVAFASVKKEVASESKENAFVSKTEELAEQEEKAHSLILLSMSDEVLYEVANEETASGLWLKLEKLYMTKSICNKLFLKRRLFGLHMKEGTSLKDHLDRIKRYRC